LSFFLPAIFQDQSDWKKCPAQLITTSFNNATLKRVRWPFPAIFAIQPHLTRSLKRLIGQTPAQILKK
jgi:hypothetical protein